MAQETLDYLVRVNDRDLKELKRNIDSANRGLDQDLGKASTSADGHLRKVHTATKLLAAATGVELVEGLKKSYDAAIEAQRAQQQTEVQLRALHISYAAHRKDIDETIKKTSELAAFEQKDLQQSFTRLLPATHNVNRALQEMSLAADIARARHISLESATNLVTRANTGSAGALRRLGITLVATHENVNQVRESMAEYKKTHDNLSPAMQRHFQDELANAKAEDLHAQATKNITTLQQTFAGSAKQYGESAAGAQDRFKNSINEVEIALGKGLMPIITTVLNQGARLLTWTTKHAAETKIALGVVAAFGTALLVAKGFMFALESATTIATAAQKLFAAAQWLVNAALSANPIGLVVLAIGTLVAAFIVAWRHSETFRNIVTGVWTTVQNITKSAISVILGGIDLFLGGLQKVLEAAGHLPFVGGKFRDLADRVGDARDAVHNLRDRMDEIHSKTVTLSVQLKFAAAGASSVGNIVGGQGDGIMGAVTSGAQRYVAEHNDQLARQFAPTPSGVFFPGSGFGGPSSINPGLYDDIALGSRYGLHISSGYRPGAITSTGNRSNHSVYPSKAVDMADGEAQMRAFFLAEIGRPGISELIHSPYWWHPGSGVQHIPPNAGTVLKDHYSHVHVGIYDQGGVLPPGLTLALNLTGKPERVVGPQEGGGGPLVVIKELHVHDDADFDRKVGSAVNRALGVRS